jgi:methane monooxygenase component A alpha chain/propane monooxygenase large subunit
VVRDVGFVRSDESTLIAQPHLRDDGRWTLDDLRARGIEIVSPNIRVAEEQGLPSGDWSS